MLLGLPANNRVLLLKTSTRLFLQNSPFPSPPFFLLVESCFGVKPVWRCGEVSLVIFLQPVFVGKQLVLVSGIPWYFLKHGGGHLYQATYPDFSLTVYPGGLLRSFWHQVFQEAPGIIYTRSFLMGGIPRSGPSVWQVIVPF